MFAIFIAPASLVLLIPVVVGLVSSLIFLGQSAWDAYFTTDVHDKILCALYCSIGDDGKWTDAQFAEFIAQLNTNLPANDIKPLFVGLMQRIGAIGLSDYAAIGTSAAADCSDCDCPTCLTDWTEVVGNEKVFVDESTIQIVASTGHGDALYYAGVIAPADNICRTFSITVPSGSITNGKSWSVCGEGSVASHSDAFNEPGSTCYRTIYWVSTVPFTIRIHCDTDCSE